VSSAPTLAPLPRTVDQSLLDPSSAKPDRRHPVWPWIVTAAALLPILAVNQYFSHFRSDETDAWLFAYYGRELLRGARLYADLWDNKPPLMYWFNAAALWLGGGSLAAVRAACAAVLLAAAGMIFLTARRLYGSWPACAVTVVAVMHLTLDYYHVGTDRSETLLVLFELAAFYWYVRAETDGVRQSAVLVACGACAGLSFCTKQIGLATAGAVVLHTVYQLATGRTTTASALGRLTCVGAGWAAMVGGVWMVLAYTSDLHWAWDAIFAFNVELSQSRVSRSWWPQWFGMRDNLYAMRLPLLLIGSSVAYALIWGRRNMTRAALASTARPSLTAPNVLFGCWLAIGLYLAQVGLDERMHYYAVALPPLVMWGGHGLGFALRCAGADRHGGPSYPAVLILALAAALALRPLEMHRDTLARVITDQSDEQSGDKLSRLADHLRSITAPEARLFVCSYDPRLYWPADRRQAVRYILLDNRGVNDALSRRRLNELVSQLQALPPDVVVAEPDWLRRATSGGGDDNRLDYGSLANWIGANYEQPDAMSWPSIWRRTTDNR